MAERGRQFAKCLYFEKKQLEEAKFFGNFINFGENFQVSVFDPLNRLISKVHNAEISAPLLCELKCGFSGKP